MKIDIKDYRKYTPQELVEYAARGLLVCGDVDIEPFLRYILEDYCLRNSGREF